MPRGAEPVWMRPARIWMTLLAVVSTTVAGVGSVAPVSAATMAGERTPACPRTEEVDGIGMACRSPGGLLEVFAPDGASVGTTHGTDPDLPGTFADAAPSEPRCVSDPLADPYYARVIYARAADDDDLYDSKVEEIRNAVSGALGYVNEAAIEGGATGGSVYVRCTTQGVITVDEVVLPTAKADANFSTVTRDLTLLGYNDLRVKYWVHYDDQSACACGGTGNLYSDDSPSEANANNGNGTQPMFAVIWDRTNALRTWLHELGHNLGAVQNSAPNTTGAGHCVDGRDIMCYNDGGLRSAAYTTSACSVQVFDCGKDDYFDLQPAPGSYLATKWNLGSRANRYLWLTGVPTLGLNDPRPGVIYAAGCGPTTPALPAGPTGETRSAVVIGLVCVRLTVRDAPAAVVSAFVEGALRGSASAPVSVDPDGTQRWQLEFAHGAGCCFRTLRIDAVTAGGFSASTTARILPVA